jgi:hypothetical protein
MYIRSHPRRTIFVAIVDPLFSNEAAIPLRDSMRFAGEARSWDCVVGSRGGVGEERVRNDERREASHRTMMLPTWYPVFNADANSPMRVSREDSAPSASTFTNSAWGGGELLAPVPCDLRLRAFTASRIPRMLFSKKRIGMSSRFQRPCVQTVRAPILLPISTSVNRRSPTTISSEGLMGRVVVASDVGVLWGG